MWAASEGRGEAFHLATFKAYFALGLNIGSTNVLLEIARAVGLPETEAARVLTDRLYKEQVDRDWQESRIKGITAVPTFAMGQHRLVGAQSYQDLVEMVCLNGAEKKREPQ